MREIKKGSDLRYLASTAGISITQLASELGYISDAQIKRLIAADMPLARKVYIACKGVMLERGLF
jgi:hypothetical protein